MSARIPWNVQPVGIYHIEHDTSLDNKAYVYQIELEGDGRLFWLVFNDRAQFQKFDQIHGIEYREITLLPSESEISKINVSQIWREGFFLNGVYPTNTNWETEEISQLIRSRLKEMQNDPEFLQKPQEVTEIDRGEGVEEIEENSWYAEVSKEDIGNICALITTIGALRKRDFWRAPSLWSLGNKIEHVKALHFLAVIFSNKTLTQNMCEIFDKTYFGYNTGKLFVKRLHGSLRRYEDQEFFSEQIRCFTTFLNLNEEETQTITDLLQKYNCDGIYKFLMRRKFENI